MTHRIRWQPVVSLVACFVFFAAIGRVAAQNPTATLVGTVLDPAGAAVEGAQIEVRNAGTNETRKAQSDMKGEFTLANLAPGTYDVTVSMDGFRTLRETGLELQLDQEARMQYHLQVGAVSEKIEVTASVPLINTENASKGDVMVSEEMVEMPLDGRSFSDLAFLMPSVVPSVAVSGGGFQSNFVTNGQRGDNVNFVIDGFNNRNPRDGSPQAAPNLDAMQEFKMETTGYSAESGRTAGGLMTMVLKSGGNQVHGTLFEFLRNSDMDARNFFATQKPELRRNQFGGTISGPVYIPKLYNGRNRTFFLFSWESYRQVLGSPAFGVVPTAAARQGSFASAIRDPLNGNAAFPGNQIPASRMSPAALNIQNFYPAANYAGVNNLYSALSVPSNWDSEVIKIDQTLSPRDTLSFKYLKRYNRAQTQFGNAVNGSIPGFGQNQGNHQTLGGLSYTRMFTPALINELRFSISRSTEQDFGMTQGTNYYQQLGIPGGPTDPTLIGFPQVVVTGYSNLGPAVQMPLRFWVTSYDYSDTLTWVKGSHLIKIGGEALHTQFYRVYVQNSRGSFNFTGGWTGQAYADFLLGMMNSDSILYGTVKSYLMQTGYSSFVQDSWKVSDRLTLSLGLRYELPLPLYDKYGRLASYIPQINKLVIASDAGLAPGVGFANPSSVETSQQAGIPFSLQETSYRKFAPRIGFAWRPTGGNRTVLRGGYGIFFGTWEFNDILNNFAGSFPFVINVNNNRIANNPTYLTLANPFPAAPSLVQNVVSVNGFQLPAPNPYTQSWNLTTERDLGHGAAIEAAYVGSKGTHLSHQSNINQPIRSAATAPNFPVPIAPWSNINYIGFDLNSIYNAGIFTFRRRFTNNFFYRASYTYSKSIDTGSVFLGSPPQDPRNMRLERGRSDFDAGHTLNMMFSWESPRRYHVLLRGWQLAGTGIARTGVPFTLTESAANLNLGEAGRPNRIAKGTLASPSPAAWYDVTAFPAVPTGSYQFGTAGRNILDAPGLLQANLSLCRNFAVREKGRLQVRWDAFNFMNRVNLGRPVATVNTANAATITSANAARSMQVALRYSF
jgi:hypothetical protein